jgi:hypothetical protein
MELYNRGLYALLVACIFITPSFAEFSQSSIDDGSALTYLSEQALATAQILNRRFSERGFGGSCTASNLRVRREWFVSHSYTRSNSFSKSESP